MSNLQAIYLAQRRYKEAEPIANEVMQIRRRVLGEEHPDTLRSAHNLAAIYGSLGRYREAEHLFAGARNGRRRVLGENHPDTLFTQLRLASVLRDQRRYNEAEVIALAAYRGLRDTLGAEHDRTRTAIEDLVKLYEAWGRNESAAEWRARLPKEGALQR